MASISSTAPVAATTAPQTGETAVGKLNADYQMFLKLLTTQMQNQDPLDPMDSSEYTQQLVQFSAVEQSIEQTTALKAILARLSSGDLAGASALIGKEVQFSSPTSGFSGAGPAQWAWSLDRQAASATAEIRDSLGRKVASVALDPADTQGRLGWTGTMSNGARAPDGAYSLSIVAQAADGSSIPSTVGSVGLVQDVTVENGETRLGVNGINLPFATVKRISGAAG